MRNLILVLLLGITTANLSAQSWKEIYDKTDKCWGRDWQACAEILEEAKVVALEEFGAIDSSYALTINDLGICYMVMGKFFKALPLYKESLTIIEKTQGKEHHTYAITLNNLGGLYKLMGDYEEALLILKQSLAATKKSLGKDHKNYPDPINNLGTLYLAMGKYELALPYLIEARELAEREEDKANVNYQIGINNLANTHYFLGDHKQALSLLQEAVNDLEAKKRTQYPEYGFMLNNLGLMYNHTGNNEQALILIHKALEHTATVLGKDHPNYGNRLSNLSRIYGSVGNQEKAFAYCEEALENTEKTLGTSHKSYGISLHEWARLNHINGAYEEALAGYQTAHEITKNTQGTHHSGYGNGLLSLSNIHSTLGNNDQAFQYLQELAVVLSQQLSDQFAALSDELQVSLLRTKKQQFDRINRFMLAHPEYTEMRALGYNQQLLLKGFLQNNQAKLFQNLRTHPDSSVQAEFIQWERFHRILARQYQKPIQERMAAFDSLKTLTEQLEISLANHSLAFRTARQSVQWEEVRDHLQEGEAAIEFLHVLSSEKEDSSIMYVAMILQAGDSLPDMVTLFAEKELKKLMGSQTTQSIQQELYAVRGIKPKKKQVQGFGNVRDLLWKPIEPLLDGVHTIYYAPSGLLHRINLDAIPIDKNRLLSDEYSLIRLGSTRSLIIDKALSSQSPLSSSHALLMGGIEYGEGTTSADSTKNPPLLSTRGNAVNWGYLPGTSQEVKIIHDLFENHGFTVDLTIGSTATEDKLLGLDTSPKVLHLATHGYFFPDPNESQESSDDKLIPVQQSEHPMVRSGLILAGANHAWTGNPIPEGQEDGILTAYEISRMDLSNTELVVLSACETGLGDIQGNEGVYGLQRAFKIAGAKYVMMSLWQVPDQATQELMTTFYENWLDGMEIRKALQAAQKQMRKTYKEPYYWAGFVLVE